MSDVWSSLYIRDAEAETIRDALQQAVTDAGYKPFNPFSGAPGRSYPQAVRLFVQPARGGWVRVLGEPDPALLPAISAAAPVLWAALEAKTSRIEAWANGTQGTVESVFCVTPPDAPSRPDAAPAKPPESVVFAALPEDIQAMNAHPKQAQAMLSKLSGGLLKKAGGDQAAAMAALQGNPPDWDSPAGRKLAALLEALAIPEWGQPDFVAVRDAYQLLSRRQRRPDAPLYAGDQAAMDAVPDALAYWPVYAGKG
jgi:hypothetical protein